MECIGGIIGGLGFYETPRRGCHDCRHCLLALNSLGPCHLVASWTLKRVTGASALQSVKSVAMHIAALSFTVAKSAKPNGLDL